MAAGDEGVDGRESVDRMIGYLRHERVDFPEAQTQSVLPTVKSDHRQIETDLKRILADSYPDIDIRVEAWSEDRNRNAVYFTEEKFVHLYPMQRYHYLAHLIPDDYFAAHLENAVWFELAPGRVSGRSSISGRRTHRADQS